MTFGEIYNKKIILDTDIEIDCDDAVALAVLHNLQKEKSAKVRLLYAAGRIYTATQVFENYIMTAEQF